MFFHEHKIAIYKGIIQYLLDSKKFSLQKIAILSNLSVAHLQLINRYNHIPNLSKVELNLLELFTTVVDMEFKSARKARLNFDYQMGWED